MCRRDPSQPFDGLSEACFQATPLEFSGDTSWVHFDNATERVAFRANGTAEGTTPGECQTHRRPPFVVFECQLSVGSKDCRPECSRQR